jgi:hypothetical protein
LELPVTNDRLCLAPILDAITIHGADSFSFQGESFSLPPADAEAKLRDLLYERCYMRRIGAPQPRPEPTSNTDLLHDLSAANAAHPRWQTGWRVDAVLNAGWISAQRDGIGRTFAPGEFITKEGPGMPLRVGATVDVYFAVESLYMQPGFYFAFSETVSDEWEHGSLLRFYWHLEPAGTAPLLNSISTLLNRFQTPYRFKCLAHPGAYVRTDSAVLFVPCRWYQITARLLRDTHRSVAPHLRPQPPLFTKPLANGLAFAEDPGNNQSFGMHRCLALARAIFDVASRQGALSISAIEEGLVRQGVSIDFPYLNPHSADIYDFVA